MSSITVDTAQSRRNSVSTASSASVAAAAAKAKKKEEEQNKAAFQPLQFPPHSSEAPPSLVPLKDDGSTLAGVVKVCLQLSQMSTQSSAHAEETSSVAMSSLIHDASFLESLSQSFGALTECVKEHKDRRCRILAAKTLALLARNGYARLRHSPLLYAQREFRCARLEDEIGTDVASALVTVALRDPDDGVSASALEALGIVTLSSSSTSGTNVEDEFWREIQSIAFAKLSPYAPTLRSVVDEDPSIAQMELSTRVYENIVAPRLVQLLDRLQLYSSQTLVGMALPVLVDCCIHQLKITPSALFGMDRQTYAKRWVEVDTVGLVNMMVEAILMPLVQFGSDGFVANGAAMSLVRLAHACPTATWVSGACQWAAKVWKEELNLPVDMERKLVLLASTVVALRAVPLLERVETLDWMVGAVVSLPSTSMAPFGITSPGVLVELQGYKCYRRPARMALFTEMALSFFIDGPHEDAPPPSSSSPPISRGEILLSFFSKGAMAKILGEKGRQGVIPLYDEVLLAFTSAAITAGRRFRVSADGSLLLTDLEAPDVLVWTKLALAVLTGFAACVNLGSKLTFLEDDTSMLTAGQASYVCLLQEYLYTVGLINGDSSVAFKLTGNSCPPQLLWELMSESASLMSKFESIVIDQGDGVNKLMDDLVARESKHGVSSHHMRLYLLTLAADQWIQGRVHVIRKFLSSGASGAPNTSFLRLQSSRDILMALSPKRILALIMESHTPPTDEAKKRRDPVKKLAQEAVKAAVASIEGIALIACYWRRRFGASQESKQIVSIAVGLLQGKVDETPMDDTMRQTLGPLCEAAVTRVQAFYESDGGSSGDQFPVSEFVANHIKPKIKPLISSARPPNSSREKVARLHMVQFCRQIASSRAEQGIFSIPPADSYMSSARPNNWLRLSLPPLPDKRDARLFGNHGDILAAWGSEAILSSAASDATALIAAYTPHRFLRHDGEDEFRVTLMIRAYNTTPICIPEGLRMDLSVFEKALDVSDVEDPLSLDILESLGGDPASVAMSSLVSARAVYRQEIKSGEYVTWEVSLDPTCHPGGSVMMPSIAYRNIKVESRESGGKWVGDKSTTSGDASTATPGAESKSGEDDFQVTSTEPGKSSTGDESNVEHITMPGGALFFSPLTGLQPCPLVFYRDGWGDPNSFRMYWFQLPYHIPPIRISTRTGEDAATPVDGKLAEMASLRWDGEAVPGGVASRLWAFSAIAGGRVFCAMAETDNGKGSLVSSLYFRGDDKSLLYRLLGSKPSRSRVIATLCPGMVPGV